MKAAVKVGRGLGGIAIRAVPRPSAGVGQAVVRVIASGICGTDLHVARDEYAYEAPVVMGHEVTGIVEEVGEGTDPSWIGTRVALETYFSACEGCAMCRDGRRNLCANRRSIGSFEDGGFASHVVVPAMNLHALPDWLGELDGALTEPLACIAHCLMSPPVIQAGDHVLITGPGAMGQLAAQVAKAHGGNVTLLGLPRDSGRLAVASSLGISTTTALPHGTGFDVALEASGTQAGMQTALKAARRGGHYVQIGIAGRPTTVDFDQVLYKELTISSGFASTPTSWRDAIALLEQKRVNLAPLVTTAVSLDDFPSALSAVQRGEGIKTVVVPKA